VSSKQQLPRTLLDDMEPKQWLLEQGFAGAGDEESKTALVNFRWNSKNERMAAELRESPDSPYKGLWPTKSDMFRHICIIGLVALAKGAKRTSGQALALEAQIERAARAAFAQSERETREQAVSAVVDTVNNDLAAGDNDSAARHLDAFMEAVISMADPTVKERWAKELLNHPNYSTITKHANLRVVSDLMEDFEEAFA
jgi:hypothetical protein